jgi:hypothetical protein
VASPRFLATLALGAVVWSALVLSFIGLVDPYGVSPIRVSWTGFNRYKPKRIDIDRLVKPYEVLTRQPRTVFMGTSRIHQSIDPSILDGTAYAPAYNASVPASTMSLNAAHLEQYFRFDKNLRFVFVELFMYNFIYPDREVPPKSLADFVSNSMSLQFSATALLDSVSTVSFNLSGAPPLSYIGPGGFLVQPSTIDVGNFRRFIPNVMKIHEELPNMALNATAFQALDRIIDVCDRNGARLYLVITPSSPYDDYRLWSLGYWTLLETWYRKLARYPNVLSFAQYNTALEEPVSPTMRYWYDPLHFSRNMGTLMLRRFLGDPDRSIPENLLVQLSPSNVDSLLAERQRRLESWARGHADFASKFERAKSEAGLDGIRGH